MDRTPVSSSTIAEVGYDDGSQTLEIAFHSGGVYQYAGVPQHVYDELMSAGSKGTYFHQNVRAAGYSYAKVC